MKKVTLSQAATIIFALLGGIHILRAMFGLPFRMGEWQAPLWVSFVESFVFFTLAYIGYRNWQ